MGMAAGSGRRKMKGGGGGVLPIVTGYLVICDHRFRTKKKSLGSGSFGTCYGFPGKGSQSFSVLTPDIKQATIETSVFGAEFVAMKHGIETLRGLRYKVRMMGIPLTGPSYIYGDNKSQVTNSSRPESTL
jgi:hypothetical protein